MSAYQYDKPEPASDADIENWVENNGYCGAPPPPWSVAYCIQSMAARIEELKYEKGVLEYLLYDMQMDRNFWRDAHDQIERDGFGWSS